MRGGKFKRPVETGGMQGWKKGEVLQGSIAEDARADVSLETISTMEDDESDDRFAGLGAGGDDSRRQKHQGDGGKKLMREERMLWDQDAEDDHTGVNIREKWLKKNPAQDEGKAREKRHVVRKSAEVVELTV